MMKKMMMAGLALLTGALMASASMAHEIETDLLLMDVATGVGMYDLAMTPDGSDLQLHIEDLAVADVVPDGLQADDLVATQIMGSTIPANFPDGPADLLTANDLMVWRARNLDAYAVPLNLLI